MTLLNPIDFTRPRWMEDAACRGLDPSLFMPERGDHNTLNKAKAVCATCPVSKECLEYGLEEKYGIWGGLSEAARRKIRRKRYKETGKRYQPNKPIEHGTPAGYHAHRRRNQEPCVACREAWSAYRQQFKRRARQPK